MGRDIVVSASAFLEVVCMKWLAIEMDYILHLCSLSTSFIP